MSTATRSPSPVLELRMAQALRAGRDAQDAGRPRDENPYQLDGDTAVERVLAQMWARGWDDVHTFPLADTDSD